MKIQSVLYFLICSIVIASCSSDNSKKQEPTEVTSQPAPKSEPYTFADSELALVKEQLFFHIRKEALNVDEFTFFRTESISVEEFSFEYQASIADMGMLYEIVQNHRPNGVQVVLASMTSDLSNDQIGQEISIKGTIQVMEELDSDLEKRPTKIKVKLTSVFSSTRYEQEMYGYGEMQKIEDSSDFDSELIIVLNEPRIYSKSNMYLKARIHKLTEADLKDFTKDELAYLRNEIFARHGHLFKTSKMIQYFSPQDWYAPFFDDATPFLNETEKYNAEFIKSLES
ncbi:MAG: YARHG domain-containing protein [bacterium]|nr:YARHG domain-containing protein [bacterium]